MKRILCLIVLFLLLLTAAVHAAGAATIRIDALDISIDMPRGCGAITQDAAPYPFTGDREYIADLQQLMKEKNIYLEVRGIDRNFQCRLMATPGTIERTDLLDDASLDAMLDYLRTSLEDRGIQVSDASLFRTEQTVFARIEASMELDGVQEQLIMYETCYHYQNLLLDVTYKGEQMPETYKTLAEEMAASLRFGEDSESAQEAAVFQDEATDTSTFYSPTLDLSIDYPAFYCLLTTDMNVLPVCRGYTEDEIKALQDLMKMQNVYLRIWNTDRAFNCQLEAGPCQTQSMDLLDDAALDEMLDQGIPELENELITITGSSLFRTEHTVFLRYECQFESGGVQIQEIAYGTIHDYQTFALVVTYAGELMPEEYRTIADEMAASIRFGQDAEPAAAAAEDTETGGSEPETGTTEEAAAAEPEAEAETGTQPASDSPVEDLTSDPSFRMGYIFGRIARTVLIIAAIVVCIIVLRKDKKNKNARRQDGAVPAAPTAPAAPAATAAPAKRTCAACGADLAPGEQICPYCGTRAK